MNRACPSTPVKSPYTGYYRLEKPRGPLCVELGDWYGSVAEVRVNGESAGIIGWRPFKLDIGKFVKEGENKISVVVYGSLKNVLGPHHNKPPRGRAWPHMFQSAPEHEPPGAEYDSIGYGLFGDFKVMEY